jgi:hypothetical protein
MPKESLKKPTSVGHYGRDGLEPECLTGAQTNGGNGRDLRNTLAQIVQLTGIGYQAMFKGEEGM